MAENNAAASLRAEPVPVEDDVVKQQIKAPLLLDDDNNKKKSKTATVAHHHWALYMAVFLWAFLHVVISTATAIATLVLNLTSWPCTKQWTWLVYCVTLTDDEADAEMWFLLLGRLLCSAAAQLALLYMLVTGRTTTTRTSRRWAAVVHAMAWVALAATVGTHCMKVASDRVVLAAAYPGLNTVHAAFGYVCLAVDLVAGVILCCSPRRRLELVEHLQGGDDNGKV